MFVSSIKVLSSLMKKRKVILFYLLLMLIAPSAISQDFHFSQFHSSPLTLNPAMTGFMLGKYRIGANYRNQWGSVKSKYETYSASFDMNFMKCKWKKDYFAVGLVFAGDKAGELSLRTNQIGLSFAYSKGFGSRVKHSLSIGFQGNFYQRGIDLTNAIYPDNIVESNNISKSISILDLSVGMMWHAQLADRLNMYVGFSASHINRPVNSFLGDKKSRLAMKYTASAGALVELGNKWNIIPSAMFQKQGQAMEGLAGTYLQYIIGEDYYSETAIAFGAWGRFAKPVADAFILGARADIKNVLIGVTYDFNLSELKAASNGRGAFEVSAQYIIPVSCQKRAKGLYCPKF